MADGQDGDDVIGEMVSSDIACMAEVDGQFAKFRWHLPDMPTDLRLLAK